VVGISRLGGFGIFHQIKIYWTVINIGKMKDPKVT